jgi:LDH2 family malate/lactate/ureidoglycolate dehydrogenase
MMRVAMETLVKFGTNLLVARGVPRVRARYVARVAVETEAFRQSTHGIVLFKGLVENLGRGVDPRRDPQVVRRTAAGILLDGEGCLATWAVKVARDAAMARARKTGVAFAAVRDTGWVAALGMHLVPAAEAGFVATAWAQSSGCQDCAPFGGIESCFSTNPIAMAIPTDGDPVVADFSTATMSAGAANAMIAAGRRSAVPRFLDCRGRPTCDPAVFDQGGTLMFLGCEVDGYKGYALSLLNEALTAAVGGQANHRIGPSRQTFGLTLIDPAKFGGRAHYLAEMKRFLSRVRRVTPRPGFEVRIPGARGFQALRDCRRRGIPLTDEKLAMLRELAKQAGIPPLA